MLTDYSGWLVSELHMLERQAPSSDRYAAGERAMAKRALARYDGFAGGQISVQFTRAEVFGLLTVLQMQAQRATARPPAFEALGEKLKAALVATPVVW